MTMKAKYLPIGIALTISSLFSACSNSWLNVNPSTAVPQGQAMNTLEGMQAALNGVYRQTSQHSYYGDNHWYYGDCRATDVQARVINKSRIVPYYTYNVQPTDNNNVVLPWNRPYLVIRQANNLIQAINQYPSEKITPEIQNIKAEALALRGLALFNLTRMYGMPYMNDNGASLGVPIETTPQTPDHRPARNTVAKCYTQVITDFEDAIKLGISKEKKDGHINYWGVQALLSRVYLNKGDYKNAYACATDVIENNGNNYQLYNQENYSKIWGQDFQTESIFELFIDTNEPSEWGGGTGGEGAPSVYEDITDESGWNNLILTDDFLTLLNEDPQDVRHCIAKKSAIENNEKLPEAARNQPVILTKFPGKNGDVKTNNICIIRLSEVYLNAAEAGLKEGGASAQQGMKYFNELVAKRTSNTAQQVEAAQFTVERILKERRKELIGEGLIYFDYLRTQTPIERKGQWHLDLKNYDAVTILHTDPRVALPIPQNEIDANPNINSKK